MSDSTDADQPEQIEGLGDPDTDIEQPDYPLDDMMVRSETRTVSEVVSRIKRGRYILDPDFQRDFVWVPKKQSKLIESCVMRIPLPVLYVAEGDDGRITVVDGLQRLNTFSRFLNDELTLTGLGNEHPLTGKRFNDLPLNLKERVEDTQLTLYILDRSAPRRAQLDIFERVNGGSVLSRQQMRNAIYNGAGTRWLRKMSRSDAFLKATGSSLNKKIMRDREAINRFAGFILLGWKSYANGDMDEFLARTIDTLNGLGYERLTVFGQELTLSMELNYALFGRHSFRKSLGEAGETPRSVVNIALFDVLSWAFTKVAPAVEKDGEEIAARIRALISDPPFRTCDYFFDKQHETGTYKVRDGSRCAVRLDGRMMLEAIELRNFKCYEALDLPCAALTVLTGYNAAGKSTALQALLLLAQALQTAANERELPLNGDLVSLGSEGDVLRHGATEPFFSVGARTVAERILWTFGSQRVPSGRGLVPLRALEYDPYRAVRDVKRARVLGLVPPDVPTRGRPRRIWPPPRVDGSRLARALRNTAFISAARAIPLDSFPVPRTTSRLAGDVGPAGEFAPYWYVENADEEVEPARRHPQDTSRTVRAQMDAWLGELFPEARASADRPSPDAPVRLSFSLRRTSPWARPANVGFGLSYAFPMLVALLVREKGSILVVDSAEAHLHPRAQSAVGRILGQMAGAGLQILVETHSDHLLNGVRLAVRDGLVQPEDVALHFVGQNGVPGQVTTLAVDKSGAVSDWPEGFFDQAENDLAILSGWKT